MDILNYKCPACGAPLRFDSAKQHLVCDSCGNEFEAAALEQLGEDTGEKKDEFEFEDRSDLRQFIFQSGVVRIPMLLNSCFALVK